VQAVVAVLRFEDFVLDVDARRLLRGHVDVHLSPKAFELLKTLVYSYPQAVSKADLHQRLWPGIFVSEGNLALLMTEIRNALGDDARDPHYVRTLHGFGYAFKAEVVEVPVSSRGIDADERSHWLMWDNRSFRLRPGENVVGRQPGCDVVLDVPGVSRRHASITVKPDGVRLMDLGSKNGTLARGKRIDAPVLLSDRDEIQIGPVVVTYREVDPVSGTETFTIPAGPSTSSRRR
jgi:DNA-binding winged helix-turn-helix (wHTH) protein